MHGATIKIEITPPVSIRNANQLTLFGKLLIFVKRIIRNITNMLCDKKTELSDFTPSGRPALALQWSLESLVPCIIWHNSCPGGLVVYDVGLHSLGC